MVVRPAAPVNQLHHNRQLQGSEVLLDNVGACCHSDEPWTLVASRRAVSTCLPDLLLQCHCHRAASPCLFATVAPGQWWPAAGYNEVAAAEGGKKLPFNLRKMASCKPWLC